MKIPLTEIQNAWLDGAAKRWADQIGQTVSREMVILRLMELGLPLFEEGISNKKPAKKKVSTLRLVK
jgi:hypothetical protein